MDKCVATLFNKPDLPSTFDEKVEFLEHVFGLENEESWFYTGIPMIDFMLENNFLLAPASTEYHGNYEGGLFEHSFYVGFVLSEYTNHLGLTWQNPRSPWVVGILHDLCKIDNYKKVIQDWDCDGANKNYVFDYSDEPIVKGHGEKSLIYALQHINLTEEEIACIRYHMGAYKTDEWEYYDRAIKKYPNVLYTHMADMHASKIFGV